MLQVTHCAFIRLAKIFIITCLIHLYILNPPAALLLCCDYLYTRTCTLSTLRGVAAGDATFMSCPSPPSKLLAM